MPSLSLSLTCSLGSHRLGSNRITGVIIVRKAEDTRLNVASGPEQRFSSVPSLSLFLSFTSPELRTPFGCLFCPFLTVAQFHSFRCCIFSFCSRAPNCRRSVAPHPCLAPTTIVCTPPVLLVGEPPDPIARALHRFPS